MLPRPATDRPQPRLRTPSPIGRTEYRVEQGDTVDSNGGKGGLRGNPGPELAPRTCG